MKLDTTLGRANFWGMVIVSWLSILLLAGAWIAYMVNQFTAESERLRREYRQEQFGLVKREVEKAVQMVKDIRMADLGWLRSSVEARAESALTAVRVMNAKGGAQFSPESIRQMAADVVAAESGDKNGLFKVDGDTVYLMVGLPDWLDRESVLSDVASMLKGVSSGSRQISLSPPASPHPATLLVFVQSMEQPHSRVVSGACLETSEIATMKKVIRQLEGVRYGDQGTLFGGTWSGDSLIGPAKGRNMWGVSDSNGIMIVQELVKVARAGGGFVEYVMPPLSGRRSGEKVSYAKSIPDWHWYIGAGTYVDEIENVISGNRKRLETHIMYQGGIIASGLVLLSLLAFTISYRLSRRMQANIESFTKVWNLASAKGVRIDPEEVHYNEFRELAEAANKMGEDRQRARDELARNVERFSTLVSSIPGIVYHCSIDSEWTMEFISERVEEVTGYPASDFINNAVRSFDSIVHQDDRQWVRDTIESHVKRGLAFTLEYRILRADGRIRWVSERGSALHEPGDSEQWLDGVIFDVTDRKDAEQEYYSHLHFLETMERVDRTMNSASDMDEMLSEVLETIRNAFGADRAFLLFPCDPAAQSFRIPMERFVPEYPGANERNVEVPMSDELRMVVAESLKHTRPLAYDPSSEFSLPHELADLFDVQSQLVMAVRVNVGQPWLVGLHQCGHARVWAEEELQLFKEAGRRIADGLNSTLMLRELMESEKKFRTFFEQTLLGLCAVQDDKVLFVNQAYVDIFETTIEDLMALQPGEYIKYVHPDDRSFLVEQAVRKQAGNPDVVNSYVWRAVTENGRVRWVEVNSRTVMLNGRPADFISLVDITDVKKAQEDIDGVIAERTAALSAKIDKLEEANTFLARADSLKTDFLARVANDLQSPVSSLFGFAKLVRKGLGATPADEDGRQLLGNLASMELEGNRLTRLIDLFTLLTAMEDGSAEWNEEPVVVEMCIQRAMKHAEFMLEGKENVSLELDIAGRLPEVMFDADKFEMLLGNLLENAIGNTDKGTVSVRAQSLGGTGLEIEVADTGKGLPEGELEDIFKPFHQVGVRDARIGDGKGAGLGLALCRQIVEHYGGRIRAKSTLGEGSVFTVTLPDRTSD